MNVYKLTITAVIHAEEDPVTSLDGAALLDLLADQKFRWWVRSQQVESRVVRNGNGVAFLDVGPDGDTRMLLTNDGQPDDEFEDGGGCLIAVTQDSFRSSFTPEGS